MLAVLGAVSIVVFWLGLPAVLAAGATLLALEAREQRRDQGLALGSLGLAALTVVAAVVVLAFQRLLHVPAEHAAEPAMAG